MKKNIILLLIFFLAVAFILSTIAFTAVLAQDGELSWSDPFNLSRSGSTTDPHLVVDAFNRIHVFWQDDFEGLVYTQGDQQTWSFPQTLLLPFINSLDSLLLVADSQGQVHAGWLDQEGTLFYSRVNGRDFASPNAWKNPSVIALSVADFTMTVSPDVTTHIAFMRNVDSPDFPAGIYSRFSVGSSDNWSTPRLVYASPYFRGLGSGEAQLSLATDSTRHVYLSWDETPQERVYLAVSQDGGAIWADPKEIDRRQSGDGGASGPSQPVLLTSSPGEERASTIIILWQAGHQGTNCSLNYSVSVDQGETWSDRLRFPQPFDQSCPLRTQDVHSQAGTWLALTNQNGLYLSAWNPGSPPESQWSVPALQDDLNGFINPDTFRPVSLACRTVALAGDQLQAVACENDKNGDIWQLSRPMGDINSWFPAPTPTPLWSTPAPVTSSQSNIGAPTLVSDPLGRVHSFWTQSDSSSLFYALWDGSVWTGPITILNSPGGTPSSPTALFHSSGKLYLAWSDPGSGAIYFSTAPYSQALSPDAWESPQTIPSGDLGGGEPQLASAPDGNIYLVYVVALNEGRGIYLTRGTLPADPGQLLSWSQPELVFDAIAAGWNSLSDPRLVVTDQEQVHLLWTQRSLPPEYAPLGLYAMRSFIPQPGAGLSTFEWSPVQEVVRSPTQWSQLLLSQIPAQTVTSSSGDDSSQNTILHRAWQQITSGQPVLLHAFSRDLGETWSEAQRVTGLENKTGPAGLVADPVGGLNLVQISALNAPDSDTFWEMTRWHWTLDDGWLKAENQDVPFLSQPTAVAVSSLDKTGLAALFTGSEPPVAFDSQEMGEEAEHSDQNLNTLRYMGRSAIFSESSPGTNQVVGSSTDPAGDADETPASSLQDSTTENILATSTPESSPTPSATPVLSFTRSSPGFFQSLLSNSFTGILVGLIPAILVLGIIFILYLRKIYARK